MVPWNHEVALLSGANKTPIRTWSLLSSDLLQDGTFNVWIDFIDCQVDLQKKFTNHTGYNRHRHNLFQHDDVIKWKHFPRYLPFVRSLVDSTHKSQWCSVLIFFDVRVNKRMRKQPRHRGFETSNSSLWGHCNGNPPRSLFLPLDHVALLWNNHNLEHMLVVMPSIYPVTNSCNVLAFLSHDLTLHVYH